MTRKDYVAVAAALNTTRPEITHADYPQWARDVRAVAAVFAQENARFKSETFYAACGVA